tara:strand:+ start:154693 stop:155358 length:666 start_codon:yes stop_codon:yes gene_type:complete
MKNILVIAVHPDDETLGAGGTILRHIAEGDQVHWLILTGISKDLGYSQEKISQRENEIEKVSKMYQLASTRSLNFPTTKLDSIELGTIISAISEKINDIKPEVLYLPFSNDVHSDHKVAFEAAYSCTKSFRYPFIKKVLLMETISETNFSTSHQNTFAPNYYVNITEYIDKKVDIMKVYKSELGEHPFPRSEKSIKALATLRGSESNCIEAEAFMLIKEIV